MAWITPPVFVALQTLTDSVMNQLSSRLTDLWVGTTAGDTDYYSASDTKTRLALGSAGQYLGVTGSAPAWKDDGVPGLFTTAGDIPYGTGANASSRLGIGTAGQVLQTNSGATAPGWAGFDGAFAYSSSAQTIGSSGAHTALTLTATIFDTSSYWSAGAPTRITIPTTGYYFIASHVTYVANATGGRLLKVYKDGVSLSNLSAGDTPNSATECSLGLSSIRSLTAGEYLELYTWQNSGGNLDTTANLTSLIVCKLGV